MGVGLLSFKTILHIQQQQKILHTHTIHYPSIHVQKKEDFRVGVVRVIQLRYPG